MGSLVALGSALHPSAHHLWLRFGGSRGGGEAGLPVLLVCRVEGWDARWLRRTEASESVVCHTSSRSWASKSAVSRSSGSWLGYRLSVEDGGVHWSKTEGVRVSGWAGGGVPALIHAPRSGRKDVLSHGSGGRRGERGRAREGRSADLSRCGVPGDGVLRQTEH